MPCICPCICLSCFYVNLNISFIYKNIFTKFAGNVYGYENLSAKFWPHFEILKKQNHHSQLFEIHKGAVNLEIFQLASLNLHKSDMARKASLVPK